MEIKKCHHILTTAVAQLIEQLTNDLNFKGLNPTTSVIRKKCRETTKYHHVFLGFESSYHCYQEKIQRNNNGLSRFENGAGAVDRKIGS